MTTQVTVQQAGKSFPKLVKTVLAGTEIIVRRGSTPVAKLVPYRDKASRRPKVGTITSQPVICRPGCFAPLSEVEMAEWGL